MSKTPPVRRAVLAALLGLAVTGCGSQGGDKAGGHGDLVVLRMATLNGEPGYNPQVDYLINRVEELSAGNVRIDMVYSVGEFEPDAEQQIVRARRRRYVRSRCRRHAHLRHPGCQELPGTQRPHAHRQL